MTRRGLASAGVATITIGVAVLTIPLATIQSWNPVSVVGGAVILAGLIVLAIAALRSGGLAGEQPAPGALRRDEIKSELRTLRDRLIDAEAALARNEIAREHSATFGDGAAHLYKAAETRLRADRDKIAARIADLQRELDELEQAERAEPAQ